MKESSGMVLEATHNVSWQKYFVNGCAQIARNLLKLCYFADNVTAPLGVLHVASSLAS